MSPTATALKSDMAVGRGFLVVHEPAPAYSEVVWAYPGSVEALPTRRTTSREGR